MKSSEFRNVVNRHTNGYGTRVLVKGFISRAHAIWRQKYSWIKVSKLKYRTSNFTCVNGEDKVEDPCIVFTELKPEPCETTTKTESDVTLVSRKLHLSYLNIFTIDHWNIDSIENKFETAQFLLVRYINILTISKGKFDGLIISQFQIRMLETLKD